MKGRPRIKSQLEQEREQEFGKVLPEEKQSALQELEDRQLDLREKLQTSSIRIEFAVEEARKIQQELQAFVM